MWRRVIASQLRTIPSLRSATTSLRPSIPRHFSSQPSNVAGNKVQELSKEELAKKVEEINPIATGHRREEIEAEITGIDILEMNHPSGPFGTKEAPAVIKSYFDARIVGCPGAEGDDEHDVVWFWLEKGKPHVCPVCEQYFVLEVDGPGGIPSHGLNYPSDDEAHH